MENRLRKELKETVHVLEKHLKTIDGQLDQWNTLIDKDQEGLEEMKVIFKEVQEALTSLGVSLPLLTGALQVQEKVIEKERALIGAIGETAQSHVEVVNKSHEQFSNLLGRYSSGLAGDEMTQESLLEVLKQMQTLEVQLDSKIAKYKQLKKEQDELPCE